MSNTMATHVNRSSWSARLGRRSIRRELVGVWAFCCLAFVALGAFEIKGVVWFVLFALTFAADALLFASTRRVTDRPSSTLDEREETLRNRAYRSAYLFVFYGLLLVVGGAMALFFTGNELAARWIAHPAAQPAVLTGFGVATLQLVALLPAAIVAWTERDDPAEFD
jgi:predicted membrane protein